MDFEAEARRRLTLLEQDAEGEKTVSRHILKKTVENEKLLLDLNKRVGNIEDQLVLLRADMPRMIGDIVGTILREELQKLRK
jgi:hypothetical protein